MLREAAAGGPDASTSFAARVCLCVVLVMGQSPTEPACAYI